MKKYEGQEFLKLYDDGGATFMDLEFVKCFFRSCALSITLDPKLRSTVRNVRLIKCQERGCSLWPAIVEEVLVEDFKTIGLFQTWGAVFKHVTLRGKIGRIMASPFIAPSLATAEQQRAFDAANAEYYSNVDWALDISDAQFEGECDLRRVPAHLVRRDPETQVVITREKAMRGEWRKLDLSKTYWAGAIEGFLQEGDPDIVFVAGKRDRNFRDLLDGLKKLRDAGVAEPD
ncbi:MAG TPA: hypothetical protein VKB93_17375 [Thermoanaerobaculia bacterium]|nr:hypothetical protein [Thermoanaerobaculia bacterium]